MSSKGFKIRPRQVITLVAWNQQVNGLIVSFTKSFCLPSGVVNKSCQQSKPYRSIKR